MSQRGSFVTEYIDCPKCAGAAAIILENFNGFRLPGDLPIIAGKIGGLYVGEEMDVFESEIMPELASRICHPLRVAVLAEHGERIFTVHPIN